jgi:hypothetical protein
MWISTFHSSIRLHGVVLDKLSTGTILPCDIPVIERNLRPRQEVPWMDPAPDLPGASPSTVLSCIPLQLCSTACVLNQAVFSRMRTGFGRVQ